MSTKKANLILTTCSMAWGTSYIFMKLGIEGLAGYNLYTSGGMSMIYVYFQIPLATLLLIPAFEGIRREWKEAVALLGGNMTCFWTKVGVPVLMPGILGTFSVLFANALAALSVQKIGTTPAMPLRSEIDAFLAEHK